MEGVARAADTKGLKTEWGVVSVWRGSTGPPGAWGGGWGVSGAKDLN